MKQLLTLDQEAIRREAKNLLDRINDLWYDFSIIAYRIESEHFYEIWGYVTVKDYVENELNIDYRTWRRRVATGEAIIKLGLSKDESREIGATKMSSIASVVKSDKLDVEEVKNLLDTAKSLSTASFMKKLSSAKDNNTVRRTFIFSNESYAVIQMALEKAKSVTGLETQELLLEFICSDWLEHYVEDENLL